MANINEKLHMDMFNFILNPNKNSKKYSLFVQIFSVNIGSNFLRYIKVKIV